MSTSPATIGIHSGNSYDHHHPRRTAGVGFPRAGHALGGRGGVLASLALPAFNLKQGIGQAPPAARSAPHKARNAPKIAHFAAKNGYFCTNC